jgi:hypothetical protein
VSDEKTRIIPRTKAAPAATAPQRIGDNIVFFCPNGDKVVVPVKYAGKRGLCTKCKVPVVIPNLPGKRSAKPVFPDAEPAAPEAAPEEAPEVIFVIKVISVIWVFRVVFVAKAVTFVIQTLIFVVKEARRKRVGFGIGKNRTQQNVTIMR